MAWTAPRTWVVGEVVTAALMNTFIRDNQLDIEANLENHTYGYHTNLEREIWLNAAAGSSETAAESDDFVYGSRELDDGNLEFVAWTLKVPEDYVSTPSVYAVWICGAAAGNMYWKFQIDWVAADEAVGANTSDPGYGVDATAGVNTINVDPPPLALTWAGLATGDYLAIRMTRDAGHINDTIDADVWLLGIVFSYTARQ